MIREIEFMKTLGKHDNLLVMVGCVKDLENPVIATEFCPNGDLLKILSKHELHYLVGDFLARTMTILPGLDERHVFRRRGLSSAGRLAPNSHASLCRNGRQFRRILTV